ncbi:unnamed protein product [Eretmochelys imbricata]
MALPSCHPFHLEAPPSCHLFHPEAPPSCHPFCLRPRPNSFFSAHSPCRLPLRVGKSDGAPGVPYSGSPAGAFSHGACFPEALSQGQVTLLFLWLYFQLGWACLAFSPDALSLLWQQRHHSSWVPSLHL